MASVQTIPRVDSPNTIQPKHHTGQDTVQCLSFLSPMNPQKGTRWLFFFLFGSSFALFILYTLFSLLISLQILSLLYLLPLSLH